MRKKHGHVIIVYPGSNNETQKTLEPDVLCDFHDNRLVII